MDVRIKKVSFFPMRIVKISSFAVKIGGIRKEASGNIQNVAVGSSEIRMFGENSGEKQDSQKLFLELLNIHGIGDIYRAKIM